MYVCYVLILACILIKLWAREFGEFPNFAGANLDLFLLKCYPNFCDFAVSIFEPSQSQRV